MSGPSVLERCRMALTEIGLDPSLVQPAVGSRADANEVVFDRSLDDEKWWLLRCTMTDFKQACLPCHLAAAQVFRASLGRREDDREFFRAIHACRADRPFQRVSCGVPVGEQT